MSFLMPKMPKLPPPPNAPIFGSEQTRSAGDRSAGPMAGYGSTLLTGGEGLVTPATTAKKTLLGA